MKTVLFADHEIGYRLVEWALREGAASGLEVQAVISTVENGSSWWPALEPLVRSAGLPFARYAPGAAEWKKLTDGADAFILLSWKHLMPPDALALPRRGTINLHYSLLPEFRGVYPVNFALMAGRRVTGVTFHWVTEAIDAGPALVQKQLPIRPDDTARDLQQRLDDLAFASFPLVLAELVSTETPAASAPAAVQKTPAGGAPYYSRQKYLESNRIDPDSVMRLGDFIDLLRGKTFYPEGRNAYFVDSGTGRKIYLHLLLDEEPRVSGSES